MSIEQHQDTMMIILHHSLWRVLVQWNLQTPPHNSEYLQRKCHQMFDKNCIGSRATVRPAEQGGNASFNSSIPQSFSFRSWTVLHCGLMTVYEVIQNGLINCATACEVLPSSRQCRLEPATTTGWPLSQDFWCSKDLDLLL